MYTQYPFSEQKQQKAKVKVKETDPTCSQIWLIPVTLTLVRMAIVKKSTNNNAAGGVEKKEHSYTMGM